MLCTRNISKLEVGLTVCSDNVGVLEQSHQGGLKKQLGSGVRVRRLEGLDRYSHCKGALSPAQSGLVHLTEVALAQDLKSEQVVSAAARSYAKKKTWDGGDPHPRVKGKSARRMKMSAIARRVNLQQKDDQAHLSSLGTLCGTATATSDTKC
jgi:hypothetical protein